MLALNDNTWNYLTVCKQMSSVSFKYCYLQAIRLPIMFSIYLSKSYLTLNNPQRLIYDETQLTNQNTPFWSQGIIFLFWLHSQCILSGLSKFLLLMKWYNFKSSQTVKPLNITRFSSILADNFPLLIGLRAPAKIGQNITF